MGIMLEELGQILVAVDAQQKMGEIGSTSSVHSASQWLQSFPEELMKPPFSQRLS